jgi:hypothetical protein
MPLEVSPELQVRVVPDSRNDRQVAFQFLNRPTVGVSDGSNRGFSQWMTVVHAQVSSMAKVVEPRLCCGY